MITSFVIMALSLAMFVYWFRYSCVLILESDWNEEQARSLAFENELSFHKTETELSEAVDTQSMDGIRDSLTRDLDYVRRLMVSGDGNQETGPSLESRMLMVDYKLMKAWYAVARATSKPKAQEALRSMSRIISYMAGEVGDRMAASRA
jgi:hypothetical protein